MVTSTEGHFDVVPVDQVVNMMIAVGWKLANNPIQDPLVYNCVSFATNPFPHKLHKQLVESVVSKFPLKGAFMKGSIVGVSKLQYKYIYNPLYHEIPAIFLDIYRRLSGKKPMFKKMVKKLNNSVSALTYFTTNTWTWDGQNGLKLREELSDSDRKTFKIDLYDHDWTSYLETYYQGSLKYVQIPKRQESAPDHSKEKKHSNNQILFPLVSFFLVVVAVSFFYITKNN